MYIYGVKIYITIYVEEFIWSIDAEFRTTVRARLILVIIIIVKRAAVVSHISFVGV
jgi:hypothetical protein